MKSGRAWNWAGFWALWSLSIALQVVLAGRFRGFVGDQMIFDSWMRRLQQVGLAGIYESPRVDYPPGYLMILDLYGRIANFFHIRVVPGGLWIKLPGIAIHAVAMIAFFLLAKDTPGKWRWFVVALFCLNPGLLFDTAVWGQVDILPGILALSAVMALRKRAGIAGALFSSALLSKFQSIVVFPVLAVGEVREAVTAGHFRRLGRFLAGVAVPLAAVALFFAMHGSLSNMVEMAYMRPTAEYPFLSMNALNIWFYLFGTPPRLPDSTVLFAGVTYKMLGMFLLFLATVHVALYLWRRREITVEALLKASTVLSFSFYMLPTEIHERYILMALIFTIAVSLWDKRWALLAAGLTITSFYNLYAVCYRALDPSLGLWMVYINGGIFVAMLIMTKKEMVLPHPR
ncbi:transporter [Kyrpidia sp.]|uniref:transporter n=1 Tax=Kyrpidia sp. TaxID=2073077 RepID=UPI00258C2129|nr:transporter [Kyrpidia sp.]MCL6575679.1 transporter [Kyrpidia sp.]